MWMAFVTGRLQKSSTSHHYWTRLYWNESKQKIPVSTVSSSHIIFSYFMHSESLGWARTLEAPHSMPCVIFLAYEIIRKWHQMQWNSCPQHSEAPRLTCCCTTGHCKKLRWFVLGCWIQWHYVELLLAIEIVTGKVMYFNEIFSENNHNINITFSEIFTENS